MADDNRPLLYCESIFQARGLRIRNLQINLLMNKQPWVILMKKSG